MKNKRSKLPKEQYAFLKLIVSIAEHGNDYNNKDWEEDFKNDWKDSLSIGGLIADIQNWCGENQDILAKSGLEYDGSVLSYKNC